MPIRVRIVNPRGGPVAVAAGFGYSWPVFRRRRDGRAENSGKEGRFAGLDPGGEQHDAAVPGAGAGPRRGAGTAAGRLGGHRRLLRGVPHPQFPAPPVRRGRLQPGLRAGAQRIPHPAARRGQRRRHQDADRPGGRHPGRHPGPDHPGRGAGGAAADLAVRPGLRRRPAQARPGGGNAAAHLPVSVFHLADRLRRRHSQHLEPLRGARLYPGAAQSQPDRQRSLPGAAVRRGAHGGGAGLGRADRRHRAVAVPAAVPGPSQFDAGAAHGLARRRRAPHPAPDGAGHVRGVGEPDQSAAGHGAGVPAADRLGDLAVLL